MSLRTPRQPFILIRKPLDYFRPRDVRSEFTTSENAEGRNPGDQVPKTDSIGPPIKTSMGSMCLLEGTNISEGRGTTRPFEIFGARE